MTFMKLTAVGVDEVEHEYWVNMDKVLFFERVRMRKSAATVMFTRLYMIDQHKVDVTETTEYILSRLGV